MQRVYSTTPGGVSTYNRLYGVVQPNGAFIVPFTTPATPNATPARVQCAETPMFGSGNLTDKGLTISTSPCGSEAASGLSLPNNQSTSPTLYFTVGAPFAGNSDPSMGSGYYITHPMPELQPGTTYYATVTIDPALAASQCSGAGGACGTVCDVTYGN